MEELKKYYYNNVNTFNKIKINIQRYVFMIFIIFCGIQLLISTYIENFIIEIILLMSNSFIAAMIILNKYYNEVKELANSNCVNTVKEKDSKRDIVKELDALRRIELNVMKIKLYRMKINTFDKKLYIINELNEELKEIESKKWNNSVIIVIFIPVVIDIILTFYSIQTVTGTISDFFGMVIFSLAKYVFVIWALCWSVKIVFQVFSQKDSKKAQLKSLISILNELLISE